MGTVAYGYKSPIQAQANTSGNAMTAPNQIVGTDKASVDKQLATDVTALIASKTSIPASTSLTELSVSLDSQTEMTKSSEVSTVTKPQIIQTVAARDSIEKYVVKDGDTIESLASKFGLSADTIRWANGLKTDDIKGKTLTILPLDGVFYTWKNGDNLSDVASKYQASPERILSFNDLEKNKIREGTQIVLPAGVLPEKERPNYKASRGRRSYGGYDYGTAGSYGSSGFLRYGILATAGNRYAYGNCTYYAYERRLQMGRPIGSFWGNASSWAYNARAAGLLVDNNPAVGAIMQNGGGYGGYGHVAIVESVNPDGSFRVSEMNAYYNGGGFNKVSYRDVPASSRYSYNFIH